MPTLHEWITQQVDQAEAAAAEDPAALRRCEADRRILARHKPWASGSEECDGCDQDLTTNLNDCPELLDLALAHGLTDGILGALDRPQPPAAPERTASLTPAQDLRRAFDRFFNSPPAREAPATFRPAPDHRRK
ncbi:hypothetical protein ABZ135_01445 [Streptomyces sp. NPDC006339]|uniref:hypothetical protein n=1 Tax=Streptomyces sp. NPDC006339 TaxID=3156755 RepID=UPI0033A92EE0